MKDTPMSTPLQEGIKSLLDTLQHLQDQDIPLPNVFFPIPTSEELETMALSSPPLAYILNAGYPEKTSLYDEEGIEGWMWTHQDGGEWTAMGDWNEPPPLHPLLEP